MSKPSSRPFKVRTQFKLAVHISQPAGVPATSQVSPAQLAASGRCTRMHRPLAGPHSLRPTALYTQSTPSAKCAHQAPYSRAGSSCEPRGDHLAALTADSLSLALAHIRVTLNGDGGQGLGLLSGSRFSDIITTLAVFKFGTRYEEKRWLTFLQAAIPGCTEPDAQWLVFFLESIFIDQAALNGTRPRSPSGVKPARPLVGRYFKVQFREWVRRPKICSLLGWDVGPQSHQ